MLSPTSTSSSPTRKRLTTRNTIAWLVSQAIVALSIFLMLRNTVSVSYHFSLLSNLDVVFDAAHSSLTSVASSEGTSSHDLHGKRMLSWNFATNDVSSHEFLFPMVTHKEEDILSSHLPPTSLTAFSYNNAMPDTPQSNDTCIPMEDWHTAQYPSCNNIHEAFSPIAQMSLVNWGSVSYVMKLTGYNPAIVLKGNKYKRFDDSAHALKSRHKDAIVQEHVSSSAFVASIFGHCGASVLAPLSDSGDLHDYIDSVRGGEGEELDALSKLKIAVHLSSGLAALHGLKSEPNATYTASYVHNDLDVSQYINHNGIFQLNDFNLGKFIQKRKGDSSVRACFGSPGMSTAMYRAPEDVAYLLARKGRNVRNKKLAELVKGKKVPFDYSKADVFSLGTAMYMLLTNKWMWELRDVHASLLKLIQGERPPIPDKYSNMALNNLSGTAVEVNHETTPRHNTTSSNNTTLLHPAVLLHNNATEAAATKAIIAAINLCWVHEPTERASAYKVAAFLNQQLKILLRLPENEPVPLDTLRVTMPPIEDGPQDYDNVMMAW